MFLKTENPSLTVSIAASIFGLCKKVICYTSYAI